MSSTTSPVPTVATNQALKTSVGTDTEVTSQYAAPALALTNKPVVTKSKKRSASDEPDIEQPDNKKTKTSANTDASPTSQYTAASMPAPNKAIAKPKKRTACDALDDSHVELKKAKRAASADGSVPEEPHTNAATPSTAAGKRKLEDEEEEHTVAVVDVDRLKRRKRLEDLSATKAAIKAEKAKGKPKASRAIVEVEEVVTKKIVAASKRLVAPKEKSAPCPPFSTVPEAIQKVEEAPKTNSGSWSQRPTMDINGYTFAQLRAGLDVASTKKPHPGWITVLMGRTYKRVLADSPEALAAKPPRKLLGSRPDILVVDRAALKAALAPKTTRPIPPKLEVSPAVSVKERGQLVENTSKKNIPLPSCNKRKRVVEKGTQEEARIKRRG